VREGRLSQVKRLAPRAALIEVPASDKEIFTRGSYVEDERRRMSLLAASRESWPIHEGVTPSASSAEPRLMGGLNAGS
jgi:hypothetical protein